MKILFIGNSHTYFNDMVASVQRLYTLHGEETPDVTMLTVGGMTLQWHSKEPQTRFNLKYGNYDIVVLQQVAHGFAGEEDLFNGFKAILPLIEGANKVPEICMYMTWSEKDNPQGQEIMSSSYEHLAQEYDTMLAPVGRIWDTLRNEHPELYWEDGQHASPYGSYLVALTMYATFGGRMLDADVCAKLGEELKLDASSVDAIIKAVKAYMQ